MDKIHSDGLLRVLRRIDSPQTTSIQLAGQTCLNFSSNDYLGLANDPRLKQAAKQAIDQFGAGSGASRLICGSLTPHADLESALRRFKQCEAALTFSSGYAAAVGTICALLDKEDVIIVDRLVHASIIDAARLCGAKMRVFDHNDLGSLKELLTWARGRISPTPGRTPQTLVVTESVFSMDGDVAPLAGIVELKEQFGAWLMVDEAHGTGVFGSQRRGAVEEAGISGRVEIQMGTLGKALGSAGGFICGSQVLVDYLVNRARSFIFSTAPVPAASAAASAAIQIVQSEEGVQLATQLWRLVERLTTRLREDGWNLGPTRSPIIPIILGDESTAVSTANSLRERGIFIPAIRYPSVARGQARLRLTLSASHTDQDLDHLIDALIELRGLNSHSQQ